MRNNRPHFKVSSQFRNNENFDLVLLSQKKKVFHCCLGRSWVAIRPRLHYGQFRDLLSKNTKNFGFIDKKFQPISKIIDKLQFLQ